MTLDQFAASGVSLMVALPALGTTVYLAGGETARAAMMADPAVGWLPGRVWSRERMTAECEAAGIPQTIAALVECLGGRVVGWVPAPPGSGG